MQEDKNNKEVKKARNRRTISLYYSLGCSPFWALGFDCTSSTTVVTASAYMSFRGLANHWWKNTTDKQLTIRVTSVAIVTLVHQWLLCRPTSNTTKFWSWTTVMLLNTLSVLFSDVSISSTSPVTHTHTMSTTFKQPTHTIHTHPHTHTPVRWRSWFKSRGKGPVNGMAWVCFTVLMASSV